MTPFDYNVDYNAIQRADHTDRTGVHGKKF